MTRRGVNRHRHPNQPSFQTGVQRSVTSDLETRFQRLSKTEQAFLKSAKQPVQKQREVSTFLPFLANREIVGLNRISQWWNSDFFDNGILAALYRNCWCFQFTDMISIKNFRD
jgi:hypothetical protein